MQNPTPKFRQVLLFWRNQVIYMINWTLWRAPTTVEFNVFGWNFTYVFYLIISAKGCSGFCFFYLDLELLIKCKTPGVYQCVETAFFFFLIFTNNSRSKQDQKNLKQPFVDAGKCETCATFQ